MAGITLHTTRQVVPMIYAYTTPEIARHNGWTKIGYTEQSVDKRLKQQTHTADVLYHEEWRGNAVYDDAAARCSPTTISMPTPQAPGGERPQKRVVPSGWGAVPAVFSGFPHEPGPGAAGCRHRLHCGRSRQGLSATPRPITRATPAGNTSGTPSPALARRFLSTISASRSMHRRCSSSPTVQPSPIAGTATMCAFWAGSPAICLSAMWMLLPGSPMCWTSKAIWMPPHRARNCISALSSSACRT